MTRHVEETTTFQTGTARMLVEAAEALRASGETVNYRVVARSFDVAPGDPPFMMEILNVDEDGDFVGHALDQNGESMFTGHFLRSTFDDVVVERL